MFRRKDVLFIVTTFLFLLIAALCNAQSNGCIPIDHLPFTISASGNYCFTRNLSSVANSGSAISMIDANMVVIDLKGFRMSGNGKPSNQAIGISALDSTNVTVKNGTISGFFVGIMLTSDDVPFASRSHLVENIRAVQNRAIGIEVCCRHSIVRNNQVIQTGGSTVTRNAVGIVIDDANATVYNNVVTDTLGKPSGTSNGIELYRGGTVVERNRIGNTDVGDIGIFISGGSPDFLIIDNRVTNMDRGIVFSTGSSGKYRDNLTAGVSTPYTGGTDAGNNN